MLLKNTAGILPINKNKVKSIAVIGPNADQVQFGDYSITKSNNYFIPINLLLNFNSLTNFYRPSVCPVHTTEYVCLSFCKALGFMDLFVGNSTDTDSIVLFKKYLFYQLLLAGI